MIVTQPQEALWAWMNKRMQIPASEDFRAIGGVVDDCLLAVVGYNNFVGRTCHMHIAIDDPRGFSRTFIRTAFDYAFRQADRREVFAAIISSNQKSLTLATRVGFKEFYRVVGDEGEPSLVMLQMKRGECRWL